RLALLRLGRSVRHAGTRKEHADYHGQFVRLTTRAPGREIRHYARSLSAWIFRQGDGWPNRWSECGMERKRGLDYLGHAHALPQRNGRGNHQQGGPFPDPARSARGLVPSAMIRRWVIGCCIGFSAVLLS